jgi:hypothetical protein
LDMGKEVIGPHSTGQISHHIWVEEDNGFKKDSLKIRL